MSVHFWKGRGRGGYCYGAEASWGGGWLGVPGVRAVPLPTPSPSCPNTAGVPPSHGLALNIIKVMNNGFLFPAFWRLTLHGPRFPDNCYGWKFAVYKWNENCPSPGCGCAGSSKRVAHPSPGPAASSSPLWATAATLHASSVAGQGIFCCVLSPFLVISPRGTRFVGSARRIVSTLASPTAPQYSCVCCLFNSTDKHVPRTHIKVLSKQSLASYRVLLPTTTESGTTHHSLSSSHTQRQQKCLQNPSKVIQDEIKHFFWH